MKRFFLDNKQYLLIIAAVIAAFIFRNLFISEAKSTVQSEIKSNTAPSGQSDEELGILHVVEVAPRFPGCEDLSTIDEKKKCADQKMLQYLYGHITYPQYAKDHGIEGRCVVTFVVETDGSISEAKILKDIGGGCGEASLNIVNSMNQMPERWIPGTQKGKAVRVRFNLPVSFKLKPIEEEEVK